MKYILIVLLSLGFSHPLFAQALINQDGYPTGKTTPEGAACDLARAFMTSNPELLQEVVIDDYGSGQTRMMYANFIDKVIKATEKEKTTKETNPELPKKFVKVYKARHLSRKGPASYAHSMFGYDDVMFVDMVTLLNNGEEFTNRTMVVKKDGKWYAHPYPTVDPMISSGLNGESASTDEIRRR